MIPRRAGNSDKPRPAKTSSMSSGISPDSNFAGVPSWLARVRKLHCDLPNGRNPDVIHGRARLPCTSAVPGIHLQRDHLPLRA